MYAPALLSQIDFTQQPIEKFLGFVILGLVITIGYAVFRYQSASKKKNGSGRELWKKSSAPPSGKYAN